MKRLAIAALLAAQLLSAAEPAFAAELTDAGNPQMGAFGGVRVRVPLDSPGDQREIRAGLALAPAARSLTAEGAPQLQIGEGLELGISGRRPVRLMLAGQDVRRLGAARQEGEEEDDRDDGSSTLEWIGIGVGVVIAGVGLAAIFLAAQ